MSHRIRILLTIALVVIAGVAGDKLVRGTLVSGVLVGGSSGQSTLVVPARGPTTLAPISAISSSWYCDAATAALAGSSAPASATAKAPPASATTKSTSSAAKSSSAKPATAGAAKTTHPAPASTSGAGPAIALANTGPAPVTGTVTLVGEAGATASVPISIPAHAGAQLDEANLVTGPDVASTVVLDGGGVSVEQLLTVGKSLTETPCASSSSASWYFASGSTYGSNQLLVALYNPLPTSAVADLSFATNAGPALPSDDQNLVVPSMSQVVLSVGAHVQQRSMVATTVSVRDGRLVAEEVQSEVVSGRTDLTAALGASSAGGVWDFPAGLVEPGAADQLDLYNPSSGMADVQVGLDLSFGSAVPITLTVPPGSVVDMDAATQHRIPLSSLFGVQVSSTNGVGIVAERSFLDSPPQSQAGLTDAVGGVPALTWVLATGAPAGSGHDRVVVENPGKTPVRVSVTAMSGGAAEPEPGLSNLVVNAGRPLSLPLNVAEVGLPLVISATAPVVVEQDLVGPGGEGVSSVLGEPAGAAG